MRPWEIHREQARQRIQAAGQAILAKAVRSMTHLTDAERAEGERLIALPYAAEGYALRRFVMDHHQQEAA